MTSAERSEVIPAIIARATGLKLHTAQAGNTLVGCGVGNVDVETLTVSSVARNAIVRGRTPHAAVAGLNAISASGLFLSAIHLTWRVHAQGGASC